MIFQLSIGYSNKYESYPHELYLIYSTFPKVFIAFFELISILQYTWYQA